MLKPSEIKNFEFKPAGRNAYRAEDVDAFFAEVLISYEKMYRENSELIKRINLLADRLNQVKHEEVDIKQAVLSAQKAADIIIREAEESVADSKKEAEAILAAAKGEAMVIRTDAEKQAIVDSDLLISIAKDKAEDIIKKAKEKAHTILIAANNSATDKMGAANRTITSESLHYDMLKKEVSEFRASILAQYKTHIELISKLPELASEEASKIEAEPVEEPTIDDVAEEIIDPSFYAADDTNSVLEFVDDDSAEADASVLNISDDVNDCEEELDCGEEVVKTTLPYEFFSDETSIEFINDDEDEEINLTIDESGEIANIPEEFITDEENNDVFDVSEQLPDETDDDSLVDIDENDSADVVSDDFEDVFSGKDEDDSEEDDDASESRIIDDYGSYNSFFDSIEVIDSEIEDDNYEDDNNSRRGFFFRRK